MRPRPAASLAYASPTLTWTGNLAVEATAAITYSVTARRPATGDKTMVDFVSSRRRWATPAQPPSGNPACRTTVLVLTPGLTIIFDDQRGHRPCPAPRSATRSPPPTPARFRWSTPIFTIALAGVLDDATYNNNATATIGTAAVASSVLDLDR